MQLNYNGISHSSSTYQLSTSVLLEKLGIHKKQWFLDYNKGSTEAVDNLLGIKYLLSKEPINKDYQELFEQESIKVYENENALPLAFAAKNQIIYTDLENKNTFEAQNEIYKSITGENKNIFTEEDNYEIDTENLLISQSNFYTTYTRQDEEIGGIIKYTIKVTDTKNLYAYIQSNEDDEVNIYVNGDKYGEAFDSYSTEMIDLGKNKIGDTITLEIMLKKSKFTLKEFELYYEDTQMLREYCDIIKQEGVNLEKISSSKLRGTVDIKDKNKYILFTIPYSEGWKVKVDGNEVKKYEIMDSLIAIEIEQGEHIIEMQYTPIGFKTGAAISIISIISMLLILIIDKKTATKVEKKKNV